MSIAVPPEKGNADPAQQFVAESCSIPRRSGSSAVTFARADRARRQWLTGCSPSGRLSRSSSWPKAYSIPGNDRSFAAAYGYGYYT